MTINRRLLGRAHDPHLALTISTAAKRLRTGGNVGVGPWPSLELM